MDTPTNGGHSVSIHASVKDATLRCPLDMILPKVSIHASVKDATSGDGVVSKSRFCFNPRICKRCDEGRRNLAPSCKFQSTHL